MNEFLHRSIHHTLHQALEWVQNSPPLFNRSTDPLCLDHPLPCKIAPIFPDKEQLDMLATLVNKKGNPLLGMFYETLWQFLLGQLPGSHIIASNLQVKCEKNGQLATLGEYDLIYQCNNQFIHRELAVKFYLGIPGDHDISRGSPWRNWVGPGLNDRLDLKMQRLLHHQATLSETSAGRKTLASIGIDKPIQTEILIQGRLFYPLFSPDHPTLPLIEPLALFQPDTALLQIQTVANAHYPPPEFCNPGHSRGFWLTLNQFRLWSEAIPENWTYQLPSKWQWLNQQSNATCLNLKALLSQLTLRQQSVYVMVLTSDTSIPIHLMIVPDKWPGQAEAAPHR